MEWAGEGRGRWSGLGRVDGGVGLGRAGRGR